jgi:alpha-L-rhamnosidase
MTAMSRVLPFFALMILSVASPCWGGVNVERLRCEYQNDPLGIDVTSPRLSWIVRSDERGERQTAYQVLVASSPELLANDHGDLWDTGRVESDQTIHVEYAGKPLATRMRCSWKVRTWDKNGQVSPWSSPASWTMGLLKAEDWGAKWIACGDSAKAAAITPHNGYHSEFAASADTVKWVAIDLGEDRKIDAVQLDPARPYDYPPDTPGFLFPIRFKIEVAQQADFSDAKPWSIRRQPTWRTRV